MLIVEDTPALLSKLKKLYRTIFESRGFDSVMIEEAVSFSEGIALARGAQKNPYDFVSLDVNLGHADVTGLNVLGAFKRFQSAWMVALLTGVEADTSLDTTMGKANADILRKQLRRDAYAQFPAERLIVVEKPSEKEDSQTRERLLTNKLSDIAGVYEAIAKNRYIFRPINVDGLKQVTGASGNDKFVKTRKVAWQVRFNCGDIRTIEEITGFETFREMLSMDSDDVLPIQRAMVVEPKRSKGEKRVKVLLAESTHDFAKHFNQRGFNWSALSAEKQEALALQLAPKLRRYVDLRKQQSLDGPGRKQLNSLKAELGPLADKAFSYDADRDDDDDGDNFQEENEEHSHATIQNAFNTNEVQLSGSDMVKRPGGLGKDGPDRWNFSARKKRAIKALREEGFLEFADHMEAYVKPNRGKWSYNPPHPIEWTTTPP